MYKELKEINKMLWDCDDLMSQDTLFNLQDYVSNLLLDVANKEKQTEDLVKSFPWLYKKIIKISLK